MQLSGYQYLSKLANHAIEPVYLVEFEGLTTRYSTGPVQNPTGPVVQLMSGLQGAGSQITIDEGKSSLGNATFKLLDKNGAISLLAFQYVLPNRKVTIKQGFMNLDESQWLAVFVGRVLDFTVESNNVTWSFSTVTMLKDEKQPIFNAFTKLTAATTAVAATLTVGNTAAFPTATTGVLYLRIDNEAISYTGKTATTFTGCLRGQLGTTAAIHAIGAQVVNLARLVGNPLTLALQILTSTGAGTNGPYDVLPECAGLGIDEDLIDVAKFESERDIWLSGYTFQFEEQDSTEGKQFIEAQIYQFVNAYPTTNNLGQISVRVYSPPLPRNITSVLNDDVATEPPSFMGNVLALYFFNEAVLDFDYDFLSKEFLSRSIYEESDSQAAFGQIRSKRAESRGMRTAVLGIIKIDRWASRLLRRFGFPTPVVKVKALFSERLIELGDLSFLTSANIPDLDTGEIGIEDKIMEVVGITPNYLEATQEYMLLDIGAAYGKRYGAISPSTQSPTFFPNYLSATAAQRAYAFLGLLVNPTTVRMSNGDDGYYTTF